MEHSANDRNLLSGAQSGTTFSKLRIVGGKFRGRLIDYSGDRRTRPMKDGIRESLFNLVGGFVPDRCAIDLFAGTGAVGIEALSRGASQAQLVERHFPTAKIIRQNLKSLGEELPATVHTADTFFWVRQFFKNPALWPKEPWMVFCCPPYALYQSRKSDLQSILSQFMEAGPEGSVIVAEVPEDFDLNALPQPESWRCRHYPPAYLCVWRPPSYENSVAGEKTGQ